MPKALRRFLASMAALYIAILGGMYAAQGKKLYETANEPKSFVQLPGFSHNDMPPGQVVARIGFFLSGLAPKEDMPKDATREKKKS